MQYQKPGPTTQVTFKLSATESQIIMEYLPWSQRDGETLYLKFADAETLYHQLDRVLKAVRAAELAMKATT